MRPAFRLAGWSRASREKRLVAAGERSMSRHTRATTVVNQPPRFSTAGGKIPKSAERQQWGGNSGYFSDPDGYLWKVAAGAREQPTSAE